MCVRVILSYTTDYDAKENKRSEAWEGRILFSYPAYVTDDKEEEEGRWLMKVDGDVNGDNDDWW